MRILTFFVDGVPVPKERARTMSSVAPGGKRITRTVTPKRTVQWENLVRLVAQAACSKVRWRPEPVPHEVELTVFRAARRGDIDNFAKSALDAMNEVAWPDDRYVRKVCVEMVDGEGPGMRVTITRQP